MSTIDERISEISSRIKSIENEMPDSLDKDSLIRERTELQRELSKLKVERFLNDIDTIR